MSQQNRNQSTQQDLMNTGRDLLQAGNERHIIIRSQNGDKIVDVTFTVAAVLAVLVIFIQPLGTIALIAGVVYAIVTRARIEIVRDLRDDDNVVEIPTQRDDDAPADRV